MSVYVDVLRPTQRSMRWPYAEACHMLADTVEELHEFAARLGLKRAWYQPVSTPHYDLTATRRARAIHLGALEADRVGVVRIVRRYRAGAA